MLVLILLLPVASAAGSSAAMRAADAPADSLEHLALQLSAAVESELRESEEGLLPQHQAIARLLSARERDPRRP